MLKLSLLTNQMLGLNYIKEIKLVWEGAWMFKKVWQRLIIVQRVLREYRKSKGSTLMSNLQHHQVIHHPTVFHIFKSRLLQLFDHFRFVPSQPHHVYWTRSLVDHGLPCQMINVSFNHLLESLHVRKSSQWLLSTIKLENIHGKLLKKHGKLDWWIMEFRR